MARIHSIQDKLNLHMKKIKNSLHHQRWHEFLIFFCFVLLSAGFWVLQSLKQDYEIKLNIPVKYKNIPTSIHFPTTPPTSIVVKVKDKGSILLNYILGRTFVPITIPFTTTNGNTGMLSMNNTELEDNIKKQLLNSTAIISITPSSITTTYTAQESKIVPVIFNGSIQTVAGYQLKDSILIKPSHIKVYGSQQLLDTLQHVKNKYKKITDLKNTFSEQIPIIPLPGLSIEPTTIHLSVSAEQYTEKILLVPITCEKLPQEITLKTFPSAVKVTCSVPLSRFKELTEKDLEITLDYNTLEENINGLIPVTITHKPTWVHILRFTPEKIEFIIEKNNSDD